MTDRVYKHWLTAFSPFRQVGPEHHRHKTMGSETIGRAPKPEEGCDHPTKMLSIMWIRQNLIFQ